MRVIQIIPAIAEEASGPTYVLLRLCEALIEQSQEVTLAALDWAPLPSPPPFLKTFPLGLGPRRLGASPSMRHWLDVQVQTGQVDLLHNHGMWQMNSLYPGWSVSKGNINLIVSPHGAFSKWAMQYGSSMKKIFWPMLQRPAFKNVTCFHATALSEYEDIRRMNFRQPVAIIPNGIDIPKLLPKQSNSVRTLLFLGRIHPVKGLDILLHAWQAVQNQFPNWQLVIAGSDVGYTGNTGYLKELQLLIQNLGIERVEFVGALYGDAKTQAYRNADLYILPSYSENFGVTVAEALATGTPAIVTKGAPWEGLNKNSAGWWIDADIESLIACFKNALRLSPNELEKMGIQGRKWMATEFSWCQIGTQMAITYQWLLNKTLPTPSWVRLD